MQIICHGLNEEDFAVEFKDHKMFLGFEDSNDIVVKSEGVSKFHAFLIEENGVLFLQDNDSLNGTFLNNKKISEEQELAQGDIIQIGYRLVKVSFLSAQKAVLDFVPPEQTEIMTHDSAGPTVVSRTVVQQTLPVGDDAEHTMVITSETQSSASNYAYTILPCGSEIGKYTIIKRLGKGGMGEVYLAKHKTIGTCRALKVLSKELMGDNTKFLERFIREAKLASDIRHPNVVGVMDVETDSVYGVPYIVMEYVDGGSLRNSLTASKRLSEEQAVVIVEAVASALQAAEEHNIVHRDIKPDNIMFTRRGEVKLADLGIAKGDGKDNDLTRTNVMIGTPAYLPPEQAQNAKGVDARADIYSLGATFYEMLTGETPFSGDSTIEILHKLILSPVPDPRKINPNVSAASAAIVMKMLAKDPKDRFQSATELLEVMERTFPPHTAHEAGELVKKVIAGECQSSTEFSSGISSSHFSLWWLKIPHKGLVISATALVFAICVLSILFLFFGGHPANKPLLEAGPLYSLQIKTTPDADIQLFFPDGQSKMYSSGPDGVFTLPEQGAGKYKVWIARNGFTMRTQDFELNDDTALDLPLSGAISNKNPDDKTAVAVGDPLIVSTDLDVVDANDGVTSLREAIDFARRLGSNATVSFAKDCEIRLSSSLDISKDVEIDGEGNNITIIGPEMEQVFHVSRAKLTLKNMTLISNRSGEGAGIMDISSGEINLFSVKDGGNAESLWKIKQVYTNLDGACHLHRVHFSGIAGVRLRIGVGSVLEDSVVSGGWALFEVRGLLKKSSAKEHGWIVVEDGGSCENITAEQGLIEHSAGGTINGLNVKINSVYGYGPDAILKGTVFIGGTVMEPTDRSYDHPIVGPETDIVLDLTERTEKSKLGPPIVGSLWQNQLFSSGTNSIWWGKEIKDYSYLIEQMKTFNGARSYTVRIMEDQVSGTYLLTPGAIGFDSPVTLKIGNKVYSDALAVGKSFSLGNRTYTLERSDSDGEKSNVLSLVIQDKGNPHLVTTDRDVVDPNDGVTSLREAVTYLQKNKVTSTAVSFAKDFTIRLSSSLVVANDLVVDGGENRITLIGPKTEPLFRVSNSNVTLKNLTLISDRSGAGAGIMEITSSKETSGWIDDRTYWSGQIMELISVKDGGKAKTLWAISKIGLILDGESHLHRLSKNDQGTVKICIGSILANASLANTGDYLVQGTLKDTVVSGKGVVYLYDEGTCENLTLKRNSFLTTGAGTINGLNVEFGALCGYEHDCVLNGTISLSGAATAKDGAIAFPKVSDKTDVVFDLTERMEDSRFNRSKGISGKDFDFKNDDAILDNFSWLNEENGCTIQVKVKEDQSPGTYKLATVAKQFVDLNSTVNKPVSLKIGDKVYSDALAVGKSFRKDKKTYSLSLLDGLLTLAIRDSSDPKTKQAQKDEPHKKTTVIFEGTIDNKSTFVFQGSKILYFTNSGAYPKDVTINGKAWENLDEPFDLGFKPFFPSAEIVEKEGRNKISLTPFNDFVELFIHDSDSSSSRYKVKISF